MELKQIKELMVSMGRTGIKRLKIKREDFELELEQQDRFPTVNLPNLPEGTEEFAQRSEEARRGGPFVPRASELPPSQPIPTHRTEPSEIGTTSLFITSPMVGTFYSSPSPEDPSFVKVGDTIDKANVVCIIEAMKVMNEIKAGLTGTILEMMVENGHPVEFGTKLFRIKAT